MEKGQPPRCSNLVSTGPLYSKMLMLMLGVVISARGLEAFQEKMRCHCKQFWKWRCLIVGALILLAPYFHRTVISIY